MLQPPFSKIHRSDVQPNSERLLWQNSIAKGAASIQRYSDLSRLMLHSAYQHRPPKPPRHPPRQLVHHDGCGHGSIEAFRAAAHGWSAVLAWGMMIYWKLSLFMSNVMGFLGARSILVKQLYIQKPLFCFLIILQIKRLLCRFSSLSSQAAFVPFRQHQQKQSSKISFYIQLFH